MIFLKSFAGFVVFAAYAAVLCYLTDRAIMDPIMIDPFHPVYSAIKILEWIAWICFGGACWTSFWLGNWWRKP